MKVIGLMSGTSADGIDAALVDISGEPPDIDLQLQAFRSVPFTQEQRQQLFQLFTPAFSTVDRICTMNFVIGDWFASAAMALLEEANLTPEEVDLIASHGQTIYHDVEAQSVRPSTLQIGEPAVIAAKTGITTVADFRVADVAAGGQGAPLVSYLDWLMLRGQDKVRAIQNIGGIGNVTYLPPINSTQLPLAFDTGPGNMVIDYVVRRATDGLATYDQGGILASRGRVRQDLLDELLAHPYFSLPIPKTTGREQFGEQFGAWVWDLAISRNMQKEDVVATATALTAASIAHAYHQFLPQMPDEVIVAGGGANNPTLLRMIADLLAPAGVYTHRALGIDDDAKEAMAFALIAYETVYGRPGNLPACTGAGEAAVLGKIVPGANFSALMKRVWEQ